jgi:hypothetical protein
VVLPDGPVFAWAEQDASGRATGVLAVANPGAVESAFVALSAASLVNVRCDMRLVSVRRAGK